MGYFLDASFQAEAYYRFVGGAQVLASLLLLRPRTTLLGTVMYFQIILNIAIIAWMIEFEGTRIITLLMASGCLFLLGWDCGRLSMMLIPRTEGDSVPAGQGLQHSGGGLC